MSTRSNVIAKLTDGRYAKIYIHFDGYLSGVGQTLLDHYTDQAKIEALIALGSISVLDAEVTAPAGHRFGNQIPGHTVAYGRDRGETDVDATYHPTLQAVLDEGDFEEFAYIWQDGTWTVSDHGDEFVDLATALAPS